MSAGLLRVWASAVLPSRIPETGLRGSTVARRRAVDASGQVDELVDYVAFLRVNYKAKRNFIKLLEATFKL